MLLISDRSSVKWGTRYPKSLTQIGKKWHNKYAIFHQTGRIMPEEDMFATVIRFVIISEGDTIRIRNVG